MKFFRIIASLVLLFCGESLLADPFTPPQTNLPKLKLQVGERTVQVPMAITPEQRAIGLMGRTSLGSNEGMLFLFDFPQQAVFWMKDTPIALSIAYIDPSGKILEIYDLKPLSEDLVQSSSHLILYALEMPKGWFETNGIQPGMSIEGLPRVEKKSGSDS